MTTTDPAPLAEQIAREHRARSGVWECVCGKAFDWTGLIERQRAYTAHIATVTEQAVRERIAAALEGERDKPLPLAGEPTARSEGVHYGLNRAARIVRGGTR